MSVDVCRRAGVGMPQRILGQFQIGGPIIDQTASRMTEAMKTRRSLRLRDIQPVEDEVKHALSKNVLIEESPIGFAENKVFLLVMQGSPECGIWTTMQVRDIVWKAMR